MCSRALLVTLCLSSLAVAGEGKWTPQQVLELGPAWVKAQGFALPLGRLWDAKKGGGLLANAVQLQGCSGSFVSAEGLLITNHHCVVGILQEHSTPQANLGRDGYLAKTRADEKPAKAFRMQVPRAFTDVTKEVLAAVPPGTDDLSRFKAVEAKEKLLIAECEKKPATRCQLAAFDGGLTFVLTELTELSDVRLVWAPPAAVGDYGGETDNWSWPRHSGDFALVRAYLDGKPYRPAYWFPLSKEGVKPGDAVAVLGYPGRTFRASLAGEMAERQERHFPRIRDLAAEWIRILEEEGKKSEAVAIAVSDDLRGLLNLRKNAEGQLAGLARGRVLEKQREADARVKAWAAKREQRAALDAYAGLEALLGERLARWDHDFLLDLGPRGADAVAWPTMLARRSTEAQKPDLEREPGYMERDLARLRDRHERDQKRHAPAADQRLLASWVKRVLELPEGQRIDAVETAFEDAVKTTDGRRAVDDAALARRIAALYSGTKVLDLETRKKMFDQTPEQLKARKDPLLELGFALDAELKELKDRRDRWSGASLRLRPEWRRAVLTEAGRPVAPDANSSLRVTFGRVRGYSPRDAVTFDAQTTLSGAVQKHTGLAPFDLPEPVRAAHMAKRLGRWRDARLGDVAVGFLADCDTTGGNSGSPVIDGKGRVVGVNFDRVWENVANDFGYNPDVARNVSADVRYLGWLLEEVEGAKELLAELGL